MWFCRFTRMIRVPLSLISHTQVLSEVLASKIGGEVGKWRVVRDCVERFAIWDEHLLGC